MKKQDQICEDHDGNIFLSFDNITEDKLSQMPELTHCLAVVKVGNEYLLGWNKWRNRYEIFGGCKEQGESARECIVRELSEELGVDTSGIRYIGAMRFLMKPDYFFPMSALSWADYTEQHCPRHRQMNCIDRSGTKKR